MSSALGPTRKQLQNQMLVLFSVIGFITMMMMLGLIEDDNILDERLQWLECSLAKNVSDADVCGDDWGESILYALQPINQFMDEADWECVEWTNETLFVYIAYASDEGYMTVTVNSDDYIVPEGKEIIHEYNITRCVKEVLVRMNG